MEAAGKPGATLDDIARAAQALDNKNEMVK